MSTQTAPTTSGFDVLLVTDQAVLEAMPVAVYACTADGVVARFNQRAVELWGRTPRPGDRDEKYCGSFRLYNLDGTLLPHDATPMEEVLRTGKSQRNKEVVIERPDGSRIVALVNIEPLRSQTGQVLGAINCFQDITERKQMEEGLRTARADLDDFFDNAVVGMHLVDRSGIIRRANRAELDLLGYRPDEYVGRHISDFHADREVIDDILERLSRHEAIENVPARLVAKDGSTRHVLISSNALFRKGRLVNTRCVTVNVTAEYEARARVREQERHARELLGAVPVPVYMTDAEGRITYYNEAAAELWGHRPALGDSKWCGSWKLFTPDGRALPHDECPLAQALKEGRPVRGVEATVERPDGTRVPFLPFPTPLRDGDGKLTGAVNVLVDLTDVKRSQKAEQLLAAIVESTDDAIISTDLDAVVTSWNRGAERLYGYSAEEMIGKSVAALIPPGARGDELQVQEMIRCGKQIDHYETVRQRKDGSLVDISLTVSPVRDANGRAIGASKIARDISERKRAEEDLRRRMAEQAALYRFTDSLYRAESLQGAYEAALETVCSALGCRHAAILLCDETGANDFVAWRGLSEGYRRAVEEQPPETPDTWAPVRIDDVETSDIDSGLRTALRSEGIGASVLVPLLANGKLIGKFMVCFDAPHELADSEVDFALTIARQLGFCFERKRGEEELRSSEARERARSDELHALLQAVPAVIWIARDTEGRVITGNPASYEFLRLPQGANPSLSAPGNERPAGFECRVDGRVLAPEELPVQRAARGEEVRNFEHETRFEDGSARFLFGNARPLHDSDGRPCGAVAAFVDITERRQAEAQRDLLVAELSHRVKNTLATVISIARQSFYGRSDVEEVRRAFEDRIRALAQTHSRLAEASWSGASFEAILNDEFAPYRHDDGSNVCLSGPEVTFGPRCALTLGMTMHELATNAAKYGALSRKCGSVSVTWEVLPEEGVLRIGWRETGGPPVTSSPRSGFGRLLLEQALASELGGVVDVDFAREGLRCTIAIPLDEHVVRVG